MIGYRGLPLVCKSLHKGGNCKLSRECSAFAEKETQQSSFNGFAPTSLYIYLYMSVTIS